MSEIVDLVKKGATVELQEQIMNLRQSALDLQAENLDLKKQVKELQENLAKKGDLVFESGVYWLQGENGREGPFCQRCQDVEGNLVRLHAGLGKDAPWVCGTTQQTVDNVNPSTQESWSRVTLFD